MAEIIPPSSVCRSLASELFLGTALSVAAPVSAQDASGQTQAAPEDRQAFFGEQHIHTSWSVDA